MKHYFMRELLRSPMELHPDYAFCCYATRAEMAETKADSMYESNRLTLLEVIEERNRALNRKALLHRLVYIARLSERLDDKRDLGAHYEKKFKQWQSHFQGEGATGMLLVYPNHYVHLVESSSEMLMALIRDLGIVEEAGDQTLISQSKILVISSNVPTRLFSQWSFRVLNLPASRLEEYETSEPIQSLAPECLALMLKLGAYLAKQPKVTLKNVMDSLHEKVPDLLIPQDLIGFLLQSTDLCSPKEFLNRYDKPLDIVLDSELVWPLPTRNFPLI
ncbi:testis-expressed protein 47-like [Acanthaster planci]|uniref:Testis-expressed protein 47-like n=1 Tax=Acanthaster planci TaxID=133434 RepID=A0A8B7ZBP0_ACAPL|nr:testis-expressed protein 47-like [Acanthaster planci]